MSAASLQVQFSSQSLFDHLRQIQNDKATLEEFAYTLLRIFKDNLHNDRYTRTPLSYFALSIALFQAYSIDGITVFSNHFYFSRVSIPLARMLDLILTNGFFEIFTMEEK